MSASIPIAELVQDRPAIDRRKGEHALLVRQLSVIREMLGTLDTVTIAGQHHVMDKVIAFVAGRVRHAATRMSKRNRTTLTDLMSQLKNDGDGLFPDSGRFARRAESLISLLVAVG